MYRSFGKRCLDLSLTIPGFILLSPFLLGISLLVRLKLGCPILFSQRRPGLHGKPFTIYKFRTMKDARDKDGKLLPDAQRLTRLGRLLRTLSIDELPELWNVLKGDMSLVGPRPLLWEYLPYYTEREKMRHSARPGLTGLSQISGRNYLQWDERLEVDCQYVECVSLRLDVIIIISTIMQVLTHKDVVVVPRTIGEPLSTYRQNLRFKLLSDQ